MTAEIISNVFINRFDEQMTRIVLSEHFEKFKDYDLKVYISISASIQLIIDEGQSYRSKIAIDEIMKQGKATQKQVVNSIERLIRNDFISLKNKNGVDYYTINLDLRFAQNG